MILAYAILVHRNPKQVARLISALQGPDTLFCVHVDQSVDQRPFEEALREFSNVRFVAKRMRAFLYSYRLIEAALSCFACAVGQNSDVIVLMSGQDYPLRPAEQIHEFFAQHPGKQFIDYRRVDDEFWSERVRHLYFNTVQPMLLQRMMNKLAKFHHRQPLPADVYGGSAWLSVSAAFARHLRDVLGTPSPYSRFFRYAHVPEELAIQTVAMNSPFASTVVNDNLRHLRWSPAATHPDVFTENDFDELAASGKLFARKFDMDRHPALLDRLDHDLLHG